MTPEKQMKDIVEAAGDCWHEWSIFPINNNLCGKCGLRATPTTFKANPSPNDLNALMEYAKRMGLEYRLEGYYLVDDAGILVLKHLAKVNIKGSMKAKDHHIAESLNTSADALREALWQAIQEVR